MRISERERVDIGFFSLPQEAHRLANCKIDP